MLTSDTSERLDAYANETGSTMSEIVENALRRHLSGDQLSEMDGKLDRILSAIEDGQGDPPSPSRRDKGKEKRKRADHTILKDGSESTAIGPTASGSDSSSRSGSGSDLPAAPSSVVSSDELDIDQVIATGDLSELELPPGETLTNAQIKQLGERVPELELPPAWVDTSKSPRGKVDQARVIAGMMRHDHEVDPKRPERSDVKREDIIPYISEVVGSTTDHVVETTLNALSDHELTRDRWYTPPTADAPDGMVREFDRWFLYREGLFQVRLRMAAEMIRKMANYSGESSIQHSCTQMLGLIDTFRDELIAGGFFDEGELSELETVIRERRRHIHAIVDHVRGETSHGYSEETRKGVIEAVPGDHSTLETADVLDALISAGVLSDRDGRIAFTSHEAFLEVR